jgi:hypothetical protein
MYCEHDDRKPEIGDKFIDSHERGKEVRNDKE